MKKSIVILSIVKLSIVKLSILQLSFKKLNIGQLSIVRLGILQLSHSQLLNIIVLKLNSPVLLNLLGNIFLYCPAVGAIQRNTYFNIDLLEGES